MSVLPALLVSSLASVLDVSRIVLVSEVGGARDADLTFLGRVVAEAPGVTVNLLDKTEIRQAAAAAVLDDCLIVDAAGLHREVQDEPRWFRQNVNWVVAKGGSSDPPAALRFDSNFFIVSGAEGEAAAAEVREWYRIKGVAFSGPFATWAGREGLHVETPAVWERRKNLNGLTLRMYMLPWTFFVMQPVEAGRDFDGLGPDILKAMRAISNFTIEWHVPEDRVFGVPLANGSWTGLVGALQRGEADLSGVMAVTHARSAVLSYNTPFIESRGTLIIRNPAHFGGGGGDDINLTAFVSVFSPSAWMLIGAMLVVVVAGHFVLLSSSTGDGGRFLYSSASTSMAFGYKSFLQLEVSAARSRNSRNGLFLTAVAVGVVLQAYYGGILTSFLTAKLPATQLKSYSDAVELGYRVVTLAGSKMVTDLKTAKPGTGRNVVYEKLMRDDPDAFLPNMKSLSQAVLSDPRTAVDFTEFAFGNDRRFLPLTGLDDVLVDLVAFGLQKDSELLPLFDSNMIRLYQSGTLNFIKERWVGAREPEPICDARVIEDASALGHTNLFFPSLVLTCGAIMAPAVMMAEALSARLAARRVKMK